MASRETTRHKSKNKLRRMVCRGSVLSYKDMIRSALQIRVVSLSQSVMSISQCQSFSVSQSVSQSVSHSVSVSLSISQSVSHSFSVSLSIRQAGSQSVSQSVRQAGR